MSNGKVFFPIHIAFFKGFMGITASIILYFYSTTINTLLITNQVIGGISYQFQPLIGFISDYSLLGIWIFPLWYWFIYPIFIYVINNDNYDISNL